MRLNGRILFIGGVAAVFPVQVLYGFILHFLDVGGFYDN